jgi:hypothetical protein
MPFLLLIIGGILAITAVRNTHGSLFNALATDIPGFFKWALAIVLVGALGWVPGMREVSRWLLALVLVVIVLANYRQLFAGFTSLNPTASTTPATTPAQAYITNPTAPQITTADIAGTGTSSANVTVQAGSAVISFDPQTFLAAIETGFGGHA